MIDNIMTRDSEIPAIFNPKRVRAPSVVVTDGAVIREAELPPIIATSSTIGRATFDRIFALPLAG